MDRKGETSIKIYSVRQEVPKRKDNHNCRGSFQFKEFKPGSSSLGRRDPRISGFEGMWGLKLRALECYGKSRPYVKSHILQVAKASDSTSVFPVNIGADWASLVAQRLKLLPAMWETQVRSLDREELLEKEMATRSSILAWRIPWTEEPGRLQSMGSQRVGHD